MYKKLNIGLLLVASLLPVSGGPTRATLVDLPKSTTSPLDSMAIKVPMLSPVAYDFYCLEHLAQCQDGLSQEHDQSKDPSSNEIKTPSQDQSSSQQPNSGPDQKDSKVPEQSQGASQSQNQNPNPSQDQGEVGRQPLVKKASLFSLPKTLKPQWDRLPLDHFVLGPMAHSMFCLQYPQDCKVRKIAFRPHRFELTAERRRDLVEVNAKVNRSIRPEANTLGLAGEKWLVNPKAGDCNDYAVSKQHELLSRGWPSRTLLLAEVVTNWGEHHLILVVRTGEGDLVLDNLNANVRPWSKAPYQWVRVQSPRNPRYWSTVRSANA